MSGCAVYLVSKGAQCTSPCWRPSSACLDCGRIKALCVRFNASGVGHVCSLNPLLPRLLKFVCRCSSACLVGTSLAARCIPGQPGASRPAPRPQRSPVRQRIHSSGNPVRCLYRVAQLCLLVQEAQGTCAAPGRGRGVWQCWGCIHTIKQQELAPSHFL
jgi:hypothetical protein